MKKLFEMSEDKVQELCTYVFEMNMKVMKINRDPAYPDNLSVEVRTPDLESVGEVYFADELDFALPNWSHCGLSPSNFTLNGTDIAKYKKFLYANGYMPLDYVDNNELLVKDGNCAVCGASVSFNKVINQDVFLGTCCKRIMTMTSDDKITCHSVTKV